MIGKSKILLSLLAVLVLFSLTSVVYAETDVNLLTLHEALGERLGVGTFAGGLICSAILLMMTVFPTTLINRSRKGGGTPMAELVIGVVVLSVCVAITWLPVWMLLILCLIAAFLFMGKTKGLFGGGGD